MEWPSKSLSLFPYLRDGGCYILIAWRPIDGNVWVVTTIQLERCVTAARILGVFIGKLRHGKEPCPIILFLIGEGS